MLSRAKFAYNHYLDIAKVLESSLSSSKEEDFVVTMIKIHKEVKKKLVASNQAYKEKTSCEDL